MSIRSCLAIGEHSSASSSRTIVKYPTSECVADEMNHGLVAADHVEFTDVVEYVAPPASTQKNDSLGDNEATLHMCLDQIGNILNVDVASVDDRGVGPSEYLELECWWVRGGVGAGTVLVARSVIVGSSDNAELEFLKSGRMSVLAASVVVSDKIELDLAKSGRTGVVVASVGSSELEFDKSGRTGMLDAANVSEWAGKLSTVGEVILEKF